MEATNLPIGLDKVPTKVDAQNAYVNILFCDTVMGVTYTWTSDVEKKTPVQKQNECVGMVCGYKVTDCQGSVYSANVGSYKIENLALVGSKYGVGWFDGFGVLFCSAFLFGLC